MGGPHLVDVPMSNALNHVQSSPLANTEAEAIERIRATLHGSKPVRTDCGEGLPTSDDRSKPTVGVNVPDSDYESEAEVEAPKASDVQLYDNDMYDMFCSIGLMDDGLWDKAEEERYRHESVISGQAESFHRVVRRFNPPISYDHVGLYRHWLLTFSPSASEWSEDLIPMGRGQ